MSDELITAENVSKAFLKSVFDGAYMEVTYDADGDILVQDRCKCFVFPDKDKRIIRLRAFFGFIDQSTEGQRLKCVNDINSNYLIVRAVVADKRLIFGYDVPLDGGVVKRAMVMLIKRFCQIPHDAVADYGKDIVA